MSKTDEPIQDYFEAMARAGDGKYAIAFAIMQLAEKQQLVAGALDRMGLNNQNPAGNPGALEFIGMQLTEMAGALGDLARKSK